MPPLAGEGAGLDDHLDVESRQQRGERALALPVDAMNDDARVSVHIRCWLTVLRLSVATKAVLWSEDRREIDLRHSMQRVHCVDETVGHRGGGVYESRNATI